MVSTHMFVERHDWCVCVCYRNLLPPVFVIRSCTYQKYRYVPGISVVVLTFDVDNTDNGIVGSAYKAVSLVCDAEESK